MRRPLEVALAGVIGIAKHHRQRGQGNFLHGPEQLIIIIGRAHRSVLSN